MTLDKYYIKLSQVASRSLACDIRIAFVYNL
uniref:Uncharacterized protein n=1 Tax=Strigamia maritima TaxID=126957 RepID=T1IGU6_STRMM